MKSNTFLVCIIKWPDWTDQTLQCHVIGIVLEVAIAVLKHCIKLMHLFFCKFWVIVIDENNYYFNYDNTNNKRERSKYNSNEIEVSNDYDGKLN